MIKSGKAHENTFESKLQVKKGGSRKPLENNIWWMPLMKWIITKLNLAKNFLFYAFSTRLQHLLGEFIERKIIIENHALGRFTFGRKEKVYIVENFSSVQIVMGISVAHFHRSRSSSPVEKIKEKNSHDIVNCTMICVISCKGFGIQILCMSVTWWCLGGIYRREKGACLDVGH